MGVRRVSETETEYKFHLCSHFSSELVKRDVRLVGIVNDISTDSQKTSVHLSCDNLKERVILMSRPFLLNYIFQIYCIIMS